MQHAAPLEAMWILWESNPGLSAFLFCFLCLTKSYSNVVHTSQGCVPGPDSGPEDRLLPHLHPGLHPAEATTEGGGEKWNPRSPGQRQCGAGGAQEGGVCDF